jgi:hypothetical protein
MSRSFLVLNLYSFILESEKKDSDFWPEGGGHEKILAELNCFSDSDWQSLREDLPNWTIDQLEIFTGAIFTDLYTENWNENVLRCIDKRFELIPLLLEISENKDSEIQLIISDNLSFINKGNPKPLNLLLKIKEWVDAQVCVNLKTGIRVENPNDEIVALAIKNAIQ